VAKKESRKDLLNEPDEFLTTTGQALRYIQENPKHVLIAVLIAVAVAVGIWGFQNYRKYTATKSHELFQTAQQEYEAGVGLEPDKKKLDELLTQFETIAKEYPSYPAGETARLYAGHVLYREGAYEQALEKYSKLQSGDLVKQGLGQLVTYHIAMTKLALKEYDAALLMFDQLSKDIDSPYRREAYASIARIYENMGKNKEAVQAYRQYLKMFPEAPDAVFIRARIAQISSKA
jgi:predicted negative regulator of RcsB-dependent stress response